MILTICKISILAASGLLVAAQISPISLDTMLGIVAITILLTSLPNMGNNYKKPVFFFLLLSAGLFLKYNLSFEALIDGANSMLSFSAIAAVMQFFSLPIKLGKYDTALEYYLKKNYRKEISLYIFLNLIIHVIGSFMLFGAIPMLYTIFYEPLDKMVDDSKRFLATALSRSFSLVALWAPGTINVILILQVTGARWLEILPLTVLLALIGLVTSIFLEFKLQLKNRPIKTIAGPVIYNKEIEAENAKKIRVLFFISAVLIGLIVLMENLHVFTGTILVLVAGMLVAGFWIMCYIKNKGLKSAWQGYWDKAVLVARDLAALFISMGIFAEAIQQAGLLSYVQSFVVGGVGILGQYSFLLIPPTIILLSLIGLHPFIATLLIGKILLAAIHIPHYEVIIALSLLLGSVASFVISPFAGNVLTLARMADKKASEVGYKWNGIYSMTFLIEGFVFLLILQKLWQ